MEIKLTKRHARKAASVIGVGLTSGLGKAVPGQMCVEAAMRFALGMKHGDGILSLAAEIGVEACIKYKTRGSRWLDITKEAA